METFKVISKYSRIQIVPKSFNPNSLHIIQVASLGEDALLIETIDEKDIDLYRNETTQQEKSIDETRKTAEDAFNEALAIVLNKDPLPPYRHNDESLGQILETDVDWIKWAKSHLKNQYILNYIKIICEHEGI